MSDTSDSSTSNLDARIAVLEERTKPKAKTIYDRVKDWSGVLTFVIAVLYTYPLGVWDRFIVTAQQQKAKEISDLRSVVLSLTETDAESARALGSITDPTFQQQIAQIANARKAAILAPNLSLIEKHYAELTGAELELLGYQVNLVGDQGTLALKILQKAAEKMLSAKNVLAAADVTRIQAQMYTPFGSLGSNTDKARDLWRESIKLALTADPVRSLPNAAAIALDWANGEAATGSWACAQQLANWVISESAPAYAERLQTLLAQMETWRKSNNPTSDGTKECPASIIPWNLTGWPWLPRGA